MVEAAGGEEMRSAMTIEEFDLITLDLNLGGEDGLSLAREIRTLSDVPIIMVTGKGDLIDKVVGLEVGADDYIAKPFHVREVLARVRSVLRRSTPKQPAECPVMHPPQSGRFKFGRWIVDFDRMEICHAEHGKLVLTSGEFNLLEVFVRQPGRILSRNALMDNLKGEAWAANDRSVDNQVARLRKKIERDPANPEIIKTVRGAGYTFTATLEAVS